MPGDLLLAIDQGTQSARALVFDATGNLLARQRVPIQPYISTQSGWAEQDPGVYWQAVCQACQGLWAMGVEKERLAGVALTTQRGTVINLDQHGNPLRPAIVWMDERQTPGVKPVGGLWGLLFRLAGMHRTAAYLQAQAEVNWLQKYQPEIWKQTSKLVFLSGYLTYCLCGELVDSASCQVGYFPFDYKKKAWAGDLDWKWQAAPMERDKLVKLIPAASVLGTITTAASQSTGLPAGLPLVAAASDKACEVLGAGCLEPDLACLSYGTAATINTTCYRYIEPIPLIPPYPAAVPQAYSLEVLVTRGYWMISWFKEEFAHKEMQQAIERGVEPEALFDELVNAVPAGSEGLVLQPYWSPGLRLPGPEARGAVIGFHGGHTRAHLYRAILEGLGYALREGAMRTEKRTGVPIKSLRVAGGGSQSQAAMQLTADLFGLQTARPHVYEASGLGAAIDAAVGLGIHPDFPTAVKEMTRIGETFDPNPQVHSRYDALFHEVYLPLYARLKPLYEAMEKMPVDKTEN
jgi:sugar (pentulose or hexulose) kinase